MRPDSRFLKQPKHFWANVRSISQHVGYTARRTKTVLVPTLHEMQECMLALGLTVNHLVDRQNKPTKLAKALRDYFVYRADVLDTYVRPRLMNAEQAKALFESLQKKSVATRPFPMNKQKAAMKAPAYFTACINMLVEAHAGGHACDYSPRELTTFTHNQAPLRTLARRVDGAFPSPVNPIAVWEIKEYYYTTTFGSRVADGVYESLLDGMELEELREQEGIDVKHYLMVDAYYTWWECGRSYLCRLVDMLHMGYVDEVLFGNEIVERVPVLVNEWVKLSKQN